MQPLSACIISIFKWSQGTRVEESWMFKVERDTCGMCVNVSEVTAGCVPALQLESSELKVLVLVQHTAPYATTLFLCECCCIKLIIKSNTVVHKGGVFSSLRGREVNCPPVLQGHPGTLCLQYMHLRYESQGFFIKAKWLKNTSSSTCWSNCQFVTTSVRKYHREANMWLNIK